MALMTLYEVSLALGGPLLFDKMSFQIEAGERIALLGRNGVGKTTLMKVISGQMTISSGRIEMQKGLRVAHLPQEVPSGLGGTVFDVVLSGLEAHVKLVHDYHEVNHKLQTEYSDKLMNQLDALQADMDRTGGWEINRQVESTIEQMKLDPESDFAKLSGGQKRRALLAKAIVAKPDVLLLDEPTNHLDIESIDWLENYLKSFPGTLFFVTHDRRFMQNLATRIMELDRGKLYSWQCDYKTFLERKQLALHVEAMEREQFDKKLAQEEIWIRQGIKARRTRNEGRVRELEKLRAQKRAQRQIIGKVRMTSVDAEKSGQIVTKCENVGHSFGDKKIISKFSARILRGDKIALIGPNGSGKTTLIKILLGEITPDRGTVTLGTNLQISYYDQLREQLDETKTVKENICGESDNVIIDGRPRHIMGYLQEFLFSPDRARQRVKVLSGGERNRLLLARLFTKSSNLLIMDEPTNDLDIETLELLEELLVNYAGTLILVSHDRAFLDNVVTSTIVLEGDGVVYEHPGGYSDWLERRAAAAAEAAEEPEPAPKPKPAKEAPEAKPAASGEAKLSFNERKELKELPKKIEKLEAEHESVMAAMAGPDFFKKSPAQIAETKARIAALAEEIKKGYERWELLESRA